jgi:hypothetical protein
VSVRETLELDITEALERVASVGDALTEIARAWGDNLRDAVSAAFEDLPIVEAPPIDTTAITDEVSAAIEEATAPEQTVQVEAAGSIGEWVQAEIDSIDTSVEVDVTANTSEAQQQIDELSGAGAGATSTLEGLGSAAEGLDSVAGFAAGGGVGALSGELKEFGPAGVAAAVGVGVTVGAFADLYSSALDAIAVQQAYDATLGELGGQLQDLSGGTTGLTGTIDKMTQSLGSSDEAVKTSLIRLGSLQRTSEATDTEIANLGQQFFGVAAYLRSTNPALGDVDQIMDRLFRTIAMGGPRLATLGIDLEKADIEARALEMSGKGAGESLSFAELQAAGISLAFEQLSPNMTAITDGMDNVLITSERLQERWGDLKEELGATFLQAFQSSLVDGSEAINELVAAMEPLIRITGVLLAEGLGAVADGMEGVADVVRPLASLLESLPLDGLGESSEDAGIGITLLQDALEGLVTTLINGIPGLGQLFQITRILGDIIPTEEVTEDADGAAEAMAGFADEVIDSLMAMVQATEQTYQLAEALQTAGQNALEFYNEALTNVPSVTDAFSELSDEVGTGQILESLDRSLAGTRDWVAGIQAQLSAGNENVAALMSQLGADKSRILLESYDGELTDLEDHLRRLYEAELFARQEIRAIAVEQYLIQTGETAEAARAITESYKGALLLGDATVESIDTARSAFYQNLGSLGGTELGTTESTNFAAALNITTPTTDQLAAISAVWQAATTPGEAGQVGLDTALFFAQSLGAASPLTTDQINALVGIIRGGGWYGAGTDGGGAAGQGVADGLTGQQGNVETQSNVVSTGISSAITNVAWNQIGRDVVQGIIDGIGDELQPLRDTAREVANAILGPLGFILRLRSPSREMFDMGVDTVTGLRLGMESQIASIAEVSAAVAEAATIEPTVGGFSTTNPTGLVVGGSVAGDGGNPNTTEINVTVPVTVGAGMTAEDGDRIGRTAGVAASQELRRILRLEGVVA